MEIALILSLLLCCVFIVAITWLGERVRDAEAKLREHLAEIDLLKAKVKSLETWLSDLHDDVQDLKIGQKLTDTPLQIWQNPCADPSVPCMNPHHDCVNCPRTGSGDAGTYTTTTVDPNSVMSDGVEPKINSMIFQLDIPIYNTDVLFVIEPTKEEMDEFLGSEKNRNRLTDEELTTLFKELDGEYMGYTTKLDKGGYLLLLKDSKDPLYYVHELFHLANCILWDRDVELTRTGEAYAYFVAWIADQYIDYVFSNKSK